MINFRDILEKAGDTAIFTFGRFNPPTTGHEKLIDALAKQQSKTSGSKMYVFPSQSQNPKKDPLPFALKVAYMRKMFPKYAKNIMANNKIRMVFDIAVELHNKGHRSIVMVVGSDRVTEFEGLLNKYNGVNGRHGYYGFDNIEVVSAGERDPDAEGVSGMSASKMRAAASDGDFDSFKTGVPSGFKDALKLYNDVRKNMGIREERDMGEMTDFESLRDLYLTGKLWNIGDVVESKGHTGKVINKGTNYLSFVSEDGKVHKTWLYDINEKFTGVAPQAVLWGIKDGQFGGKLKSFYSTLQKMHDKELYRHAMNNFSDFGGDRTAYIKDLINRGIDVPLSKGAQKELEQIIKSVSTKPKREEVGLDERNYAQEYANYQGTPEQIARRSSRNKARRVMGDKAIKGMDVGHKDNNPMNNEPDNLRMEDPSENRREPRLRFKRDKDLPNLKIPSRPSKRISLKDLQRILDKEKKDKQNKATGDYRMSMMNDKDLEEVKQDPEIKDKEGTQPAKYYDADIAKSTKDKRAAHFNKKKEGPAPGDATAKTKPSTHTKKFNQMFGEARAKQAVSQGKVQKLVTAHGLKFKGKVYKEIDMELKGIDNNTKMVTFNIIHPKEIFGNEVKLAFKVLSRGPFMATDTSKINEILGKDADQGDYIDDFEKSDAPQFKGKSKEKRKDMAIAAYLSKNESFLDNVNRMLSESGHTDVASMKNKIQIAQKALMTMQGELTKLGDEDDLPTWWTNKVATAVSRLDDMSDYIDTQVEDVQLDEKIAGLVKKADKSGMPYSVLKKVYDRGMAAWKTGHRPGTTPQQWAFARVNSFTTKSSGTWGKADKDLAKQVEQLEELEEKGPGLWANIHKKRKEGRPMRKKGEKGAPTPAQLKRAKGEELEEQDLNEWGEVEEESEYQGRKVTLNKPSAGDVKKSKVYVKNEKGNVVKVNFGDPNMTIKKSIPARRKSFRARHNCENPGPKWMARYWSCKAW